MRFNFEKFFTRLLFDIRTFLREQVLSSEDRFGNFGKIVPLTYLAEITTKIKHLSRAVVRKTLSLQPIHSKAP